MKRPRARCPVCERVVAVHVPAGGDGTADVFPRHDRTPGGARCSYSWSIVERDEYVEVDA